MEETSIPFNKPYVAGKELYYIAQSISFGNISADGRFTKACNEFLRERFNLGSSLMVTSCTSALEMAAILCDVEPGDEVILPSYTFVSTANAFVRAGVKPVFVDVRPDTLNIDETQIESAITSRTKAIVPVHYAGVACEMDTITEIADRHGIYVVEDAAQGVHAYYKGRALGSIGHMGAYSYHETKNYVCGEGGTLCINHSELQTRAEIVRDKGTNRQQFFRGAVDKYTWVDTGSSYALSELSCAFLYAQLEALDEIRSLRKQVFDNYRQLLGGLEDEGYLRLPTIPDECETNYHMFYILLRDQNTRDSLMQNLRDHDINAVFHYVPLHTSPMGRSFGYRDGQLPVTEDLSGRLLRLPFFNEISFSQQERVTDQINSFLAQRTYRMAA
ncbi:dTDP-4-amino-4,6-dideoxygalactose transaminase [bacterium]|nr:dTDP-4-amino-4,6-dideoxygalactose transaminase [bacterium]